MAVTTNKVVRLTFTTAGGKTFSIISWCLAPHLNKQKVQKSCGTRVNMWRHQRLKVKSGYRF